MNFNQTFIKKKKSCSVFLSISVISSVRRIRTCSRDHFTRLSHHQSNTHNVQYVHCVRHVYMDTHKHGLKMHRLFCIPLLTLEERHRAWRFFSQSPVVVVTEVTGHQEYAICKYALKLMLIEPLPTNKRRTGKVFFFNDGFGKTRHGSKKKRG